MNDIEKKELKNVTKAFTEEEMNEVIKVIPDDYLWDELIRRNTTMLQRINQIEEVLGVSVDNVKPISIVAWEDIRGRYEDLGNKYIRIKKGIRGV